MPEVRALTKIDIAFFPMNVPLARMEPAAAIDCLRAFKPKVVYPYHYDQDWVARVGQGRASTRADHAGLDELKVGLQREGIDVPIWPTWYPR